MALERISIDFAEHVADVCGSDQARSLLDANTTNAAFANQQGYVLYIVDLFPGDDEQRTTDN